MLQVIFEDKHILVVWKPVGIESQSSRGFGADMVSEVRKHIYKTSKKQEEPYVGVIHRLDKPVSGVMVYAKDKKTAAALSLQITEGKVHKKYLAVLCGKPESNEETFVDYLKKDSEGNVSGIVEKQVDGAKRAELICRVAGFREDPEWGELTLAEIELKTGRHHQIRVQMAGHGLPLWGDGKYNPRFGGSAMQAAQAAPSAQPARRTAQPQIALSSFSLSFIHPAIGRRVSFERLPDAEIFRNFEAVR
ncbi:RluA family pseudouridine synthase [Brotaphodocola sp.]|uniref:RluA family pseudouridine synthase n=1 Tax=Brotaphodocola sp. TaxID=3073577 RepID=UPI003D7D6676